jgi:TonB family protein
VALWAIVGTDGKLRDIRVARSGGTELDRAAENTLRQWKFQPATKSGKAVASQVNINLAFNGGAGTSSISAPNANGALSRVVDQRLHPQLVVAYDCWRTHANKGHALQACKLKSAKLRVRVIVSGKAAAALPQLKAVGFEPEMEATRRSGITGRIAVDRLDALAAVPAVAFVAPEPTQRK